MLCPCGPLRMSHTFVQLWCGWTWLCRSILSNVINISKLTICNLSSTMFKKKHPTNMVPPPPHFNLASNSLICQQYELVKIPGLPVLKPMYLTLVKVGTFPWTLDWRCAYNRYQPIWSLPWHWCYQLVCSPILGSNDISWLLGLMPGLTFSNRAKPSILTGKLTWQ